MNLYIYWSNHLQSREEYDAIGYLIFLIKRKSKIKFLYDKTKNVKLKLFYLV